MYPDATRCPKCNAYARVRGVGDAARYIECWFRVDGERGYCKKENVHWEVAKRYEIKRFASKSTTP